MDKKEYIEREALLKYPIRRGNYDTKNGDIHFINGIESVLEYAKSLPPADVQEVVRCSECIHIWLHSSGYYHCSVMGKEYKGYELGYNFCSYGEKVR